jgi:hypothetical protein
MTGTYPNPQVGMVISYCFLWPRQAGKISRGEKNRPCLILGVGESKSGEKTVIVAPITHTAPFHPQDALQVPAETCRRIGLDSQPKWLMCSDINKFDWPGVDLARVPGRNSGTVVWGQVSASFIKEAQDLARDVHKRGYMRVLSRDVRQPERQG